jgi:hypothetical protein
MNLLLGRLDEPQRRWYVALESQKLGRGGDRLLSLITGLNVETIRRGRRELEAGLADCPLNRLRRPAAAAVAHALVSPLKAPDRAGAWGRPRCVSWPVARGGQVLPVRQEAVLHPADGVPHVGGPAPVARRS